MSAARVCGRTLIEMPYQMILCTTEKQYHKLLKNKFGLPNESMLKDDASYGAVVHFFTQENGDLTAVVCIKPKPDSTLTEIHAMLVHEAVHIWQRTLTWLDEDHPSKEFEAYSIQGLSLHLFCAYHDATESKK